MLSLLGILTVTIRFYTTQQRWSIVSENYRSKTLMILMDQIIELTVQEHYKSLVCWAIVKKSFEIFFFLFMRTVIWFGMLHEGWGNNMLNVFCVYFSLGSVCPSSGAWLQREVLNSLQCSGGEGALFAQTVSVSVASLPELKLKDYCSYSNAKDMTYMTG